MFNIGFPELATILIAALLLLGPSKLPEFARWLGRALREVRRTTQEVKQAIDLELEKEEIDRLRKEFREVQGQLSIDPSLEFKKAMESIPREIENSIDQADSTSSEITETRGSHTHRSQMEEQNGRPLDIVANQNSSVPHLPQTVEQVLDKTNGDDHQDSHIMNNFQRDEHLSK